MDFVIQWLWYLLAFAAGSMVAWAITMVSIRPASKEQAAAELSGAGEMGAH